METQRGDITCQSHTADGHCDSLNSNPCWSHAVRLQSICFYPQHYVFLSNWVVKTKASSTKPYHIWKCHSLSYRIEREEVKDLWGMKWIHLFLNPRWLIQCPGQNAFSVNVVWINLSLSWQMNIRKEKNLVHVPQIFHRSCYWHG